MEFFDIVKELVKEGISVEICYDADREQFFANLNTEAKSHLHLYENLYLRGRYGRKIIIVCEGGSESIISQLCFEFKYALCGRDYGNCEWFKLCEKYGI